jgi:hypothetical protein
MKLQKLIMVSFKPRASGFSASVPIGEFMLARGSPAVRLARAVRVYEQSLRALSSFAASIIALRSRREVTPARMVWRFGDGVFRLVSKLAEAGVEIDGLYDHLVRDVGLKRKWLEKAVILRRYVPNEAMIPASLNWGRCEKGTRRVAEGIARRKFTAGIANDDRGKR